MTATEQPMTEARLEEIGAREQAAEPGEWTADHLGGFVWKSRNAMMFDQPGDGAIARARGWGRTGGQNLSPEQAEKIQAANLDFVAHAREDIPALLREVGRLKGEVERLEFLRQWREPR